MIKHTKELPSSYKIEGFNINENYMFERIEGDFQERYIKLFDVPMKTEESSPCRFTPPWRFETISETIFKRHFEVISEQSI